MKAKEIEFGGFKTRLFYLNDLIIGVPTDIGPRVLYLARKEKPQFNLFGVLPELEIPTPAGPWKIYGGHRLWASPEAMPRSYSLDDDPIDLSVNDGNIIIRGNSEVENDIQKAISVRTRSENSIEVEHSIKNIGRWPIRFGCWAISVMTKNGFAIVPLQPSKVDESRLLPDRHITFWPYTDISDKRLSLADGYIFVKQSPDTEKPLKIATMPHPTWIAYYVQGTAFVKHFSLKDGEYPDFGCSAEVYTNQVMLELETVGPLSTVKPKESIQHIETWKIVEVGDLSPNSKSIKEKLEPLLA